VATSQLHDQIFGALNHHFRSTADVAVRAGVIAQRAAPVLGRMRRDGTVEWCQQGVTSLWRRPPEPGDR
jgi:hypothetical protein